jgi:hypothetical protein
MKKVITIISAILLLVFALLTFYLSFSIIFDLFGVREEQGNYVLFVVWANLISSLIYMIAVYAFAKGKKWTAALLLIPILILIIAFIGLIIYANMGGVYEDKTMSALPFRIGVTFIFTLLAYFLIVKKRET